MRPLPTPQRMYQALLEKDPACDGVFVVGVSTTGIFCRPTCPARKPKRQNVEFFPTAADALKAGFRPCKRCHPMDTHRTPPGWVVDLCDRLERNPSVPIRERDLRDLSLDPSTVRRYFKSNYGMTFTAYQRAMRLGQSLADIRSGNTESAATHKSGYESASGFRDAFSRLFGHPPGQSDNLACLKARWLDTPLGAMLAVATEAGLCLLEFVDRRALETEIGDLRRIFSATIVPGASDHLDETESQLDLYFKGKQQSFSVPLDTPGTDFQRAVWQQLTRIPLGETVSYAKMADDVDRPGAQRAVGRANGQNRVAIIIPCHRVIRADGNPGGYGGGLWRKQWLLHHERCMIEGKPLAPDSLWTEHPPQEVVTSR
jgi:AraC family transcriptional regulator, regulatory protein of adaptative response / methylated-DNA-[protein]-cysteine methyltransferase